MLSFQDLDENR